MVPVPARSTHASPRVSVVVTVAIVAVVGLTMGLSLVGARAFLGADQLESFAPWSESPPDGVVPTNPLVGDTVDAVMPERAAMREALEVDTVPTWNSLQLGGTAFSSIRNAGVLSILNIPYWLVALWYAPVLAKLLEVAVAVGFTAWFLRLHGLRWSSGLIGGLIFGFSGFQVVWTNWHQTHVAALIAALFWAIEVVIVKRRLVWCIPLAVVVATMWFEGFPAVTVYALAFGGAYALIRAFSAHGAGQGIRKAASLAFGVAVGTGLAAVQLIPFLASLEATRDLSERAQAGAHLPFRTLATVIVPNAFGSPVDRNFYGPANYIEIQSFVGIAAIALVLVAMAYGRRVVPAAVYWYFLIASLLAASLMWLGGPVLRLVQEVPFFGLNFIGRLRSVLGFLLAVLAALGFEALMRREPAKAGVRDRIIFAGGVVASSLVSGFVLHRAWQMARTAEQSQYFRSWMLFAIAIALLVGLVVAAAHVRRGAVGSTPVVIVPLIIAIEIIAIAMPFWPQIPTDQFYPTTSAHRYLQQNLEDSRIAAAGLAFYPSTTMLYGLRSVSGHAFHDPAWRDLLEAVDPDVMKSPTFSILASSTAIAGSPVFDRMSAAYFAVDPRLPIVGERRPVGQRSGFGEVLPGSERFLGISGIVRGVRVTVDPGFDPGVTPDQLVLEVLDRDGAVLARGSRRLDESVESGWIDVPVPEVDGGRTLRLAYEGDDSVDMATTDEGDIALELILPGEDGLRLAHGGAAVLYRRLDALERVRWASTRIIEPDARQRIDLLRDGVDGRSVVLSTDTPQASGASADLDVIEDGGDRLEIEVAAAGAGFVVVADSIQRDWVAVLNGKEVEILPADHAFGAVAVPAGDHVLVLRHVPGGFRVGMLVSGGAALLMLTLLGTAILRARRMRRRAASGREPGHVA